MQCSYMAHNSAMSNSASALLVSKPQGMGTSVITPEFLNLLRQSMKEVIVNFASLKLGGIDPIPAPLLPTPHLYREIWRECSLLVQ